MYSFPNPRAAVMSGICGILSYFERNSAKPPVCSGCPLAIIGSALCHTRTVPGSVSDQCQANIRQMQNAETAWRQFTIIILQKYAELYISGYTFSVWIVYVLCIGFVCSLGPSGLRPNLGSPPPGNHELFSATSKNVEISTFHFLTL